MSLILVAVFAASAFDRVFDEGVTAYNQQAYPAAIASFEKIVGEGVTSPEVFFNLGNAYYRNGQLAPAIANYERALMVDPGVLTARENLQRAIGQTERGLARPRAPGWEDGLFFWNHQRSAGGTLAVAAGLWTLGWGLLMLRLARPWPYLRAIASAALVLAALFAASWWVKIHPPLLAVAAQERVPVRYGNRNSETVRFELYEGDRVRVDQRKDGWLRVETADGERGWAQEEQLLLVGPPFESYRERAQSPAPAEQAALDAAGYGVARR